MASTAGSGLGVGTLAAGAAVAAVLGIVLYQVAFAPEPEAPTSEPEPVVSQPREQPAPEGGEQIAAAPANGDETAPSDAPADGNETAPSDAPAAEMQAPIFDLVRVDAAGGALIAGQAEANAELRLRLDGEEIHLSSSDATGEFVAMFDIPPSERPRILSLEMILQDGSVLVSEQSVIISPTLRVVEPSDGVAVAETETEQGGPETPESSGIGELAMAEPETTATAGGSAPALPAAPELPEPAPGEGVASGPEVTTGTEEGEGAAPAPESPAAPEAGTADPQPETAGTEPAPPTTPEAAPSETPAETSETTQTPAPAGQSEEAAPTGVPETGVAEETVEPSLLAAAPEVSQPAAEANAPETGRPIEPQTVAEATSPQEPAAPEPGSTEVIDDTDPPAEPQVETQTPTVLLADSEGIRVIQSGQGPEAQTQVSLDSIAYDTEGEVVLAGRGSAEADVRFYLDNQPVQIARIDLTGSWRTELPQVDPGTYTLRLDELDPEGGVQSRIETPFLREEPETVAEITSRTGENVITVQWGNTLWGIAQRHLGEGVMYVQIYEANRDQIRNPDLIYPGQIFTIPEPPSVPEN